MGIIYVNHSFTGAGGGAQRRNEVPSLWPPCLRGDIDFACKRNLFTHTIRYKAVFYATQ
jgi:hypothetical protein